MGPVGGSLASFLLESLGWCSYAIVAWMLVISRVLSRKDRQSISGQFTPFSSLIVFSTAGVFTVSSAVVFAVLFGFSGGGEVGSKIAFSLTQFFNDFGALLIATLVGVLSAGFGLSTAGEIESLVVFRRGAAALISGVVYILNLFYELFIGLIAITSKVSAVVLGFSLSSILRLKISLRDYLGLLRRNLQSFELNGERDWQLLKKNGMEILQVGKTSLSAKILLFPPRHYSAPLS